MRTPELGREVVIVGWELTGLDHKDVRLRACRSRRGFGPDGGGRCSRRELEEPGYVQGYGPRNAPRGLLAASVACSKLVVHGPPQAALATVPALQRHLARQGLLGAQSGRSRGGLGSWPSKVNNR